MSELSVIFDANDLTNQMKFMSEQLNIAMPKIVRFEGLMLLKAVVKFTHPDSRAQGRRAVARDITRAITPLDPAKFRDPRMAQVIRQNDLPAINKILQNVPGWKAWTAVDFDPGTQHEQQRDARGRIQRFKKKFTSKTADWKRYVKRKQKDVGTAKGSWGLAYQLVGGSLPAWIAEHATPRYSLVLNMLNDPQHPRLQVTSVSKGVRDDPEMKRNISRAVATRVKSMEIKTRRMLADPLKYNKLFSQYV